MGASIAIIGAGPRGISITERIAAYLKERGGGSVTLHIIDDAQLGAGRVWETAQTRTLCMNTLAGAVTLFTEPGATVTDVGSVKQSVIAAVAPHIPPGVHFIPGHPLAGTEHSGPRSGFASLFQNRWWLLTPLPDSDPAAVARLSDLVRAMGAKTDSMEAAHHDLVLAVTSHAPHLIAYTMVGVADHLRRVTDEEVIQYSAAGFRDFTRIAASDPTMWRDVFLHNKEATLDILGRFTEELFVLQRAIRMGDGQQLFDYFTRTRAIRRGIIEAGQDTAAPDFGRVSPAR